MLSSSRVEANIPAADLKRARDFYADALGLTPTREFEGVQLAYRTDGGTNFNIYETTFAGQAGHTIAQWHVDDIESEVRDLKAKGVTFEVYEHARRAVGRRDRPPAGPGPRGLVQGQRGQHHVRRPGGRRLVSLPTSAPTSEPLVGVDPAPVADLLREAGDLHHRVYRITDGEDPDWATWYATWLVELSELPQLLGCDVVRSELVHVLVDLGREPADDEPWEQRYARRIVQHFAR